MSFRPPLTRRRKTKVTGEDDLDAQPGVVVETVRNTQGKKRTVVSALYPVVSHTIPAPATAPAPAPGPSSSGHPGQNDDFNMLDHDSYQDTPPDPAQSHANGAASTKRRTMVCLSMTDSQVQFNHYSYRGRQTTSHNM